MEGRYPSQILTFMSIFKYQILALMFILFLLIYIIIRSLLILSLGVLHFHIMNPLVNDLMHDANVIQYVLRHNITLKAKDPLNIIPHIYVVTYFIMTNASFNIKSTYSLYWKPHYN